MRWINELNVVGMSRSSSHGVRRVSKGRVRRESKGRAARKRPTQSAAVPHQKESPVSRNRSILPCAIAYLEQMVSHALPGA